MTTVDPDLAPEHRARWAALLARVAQLDGASAELAACGLDGGEDDRLEAAARLLRSTERRVVVYGPSGSGKSTVLNAVLDRDVLPTGEGVATTSVPVAVVPVAAGEPERCEVRYLDRAAYARRLTELAGGLPGLPALGDPFDGAQRARLGDALALLHAPERRDDEVAARARLLHGCLRALEGGGHVLAGPGCEPRVVRCGLGATPWELMREPAAVADPRSVSPSTFGTRLVDAVTLHVVPGDRFALPGITVVDLPGADGSVALHAEAALRWMRRDDAVVLFLLGRLGHRLDLASSSAALDLVHREYLGRLDGDQLEAAAAKVFVAVNDDRRTTPDAHVTAAVERALRALSPGYAARHAERAAGRAWFVVDPHRPGGELALLQRRLHDHVRGPRVAALLDQAEHEVTGYVRSAGAALDARLRALGVEPGAPADGWREQRIGAAYLAGRREALPGEIAEDLRAAAEGTTLFEATASAEARERAERLGRRGADLVHREFRAVHDPFHGHDFVDFDPRVPARELDRALVDEYRHIGARLAERHVRLLGVGLQRSGLHDRLAAERDGLEGADELADVVNAHLAVFARDYGAAVAAALVHELGRDRSHSLIGRVERAGASSGAAQRADHWWELLAGEVTAVTASVLDSPGLRRGLHVLFAQHWLGLQAAFVAHAHDLVRRQEVAMGADDTARRRVLRRAGATDAGLDRLVELRARILGDASTRPEPGSKKRRRCRHSTDTPGEDAP